MSCGHVKMAWNRQKELKTPVMTGLLCSSTCSSRLLLDVASFSEAASLPYWFKRGCPLVSRFGCRPFYFFRWASR